MELDISGRTALVTGASVGIGRGIAKVLAGEGLRIAVVARRGNLLEELADELGTAGYERPLIIAADLARDDGPETVAAAARDGLGPIDILINNAGMSAPAPWDAPEQIWSDTMALNFTAVRRLTQRLVPEMQQRTWGRVINITGNMEVTGPNAAIPAKAAVHLWAKGLSRALGGDGITVNCIIPGRIMSEQIVERLMPDPAAREAFARQEIPAGYLGEPEDIGHLVAFLASPLARYINGEVVHVDGGLRRYAL
jgi:3-oxoacyl-[acyl-carrier protein] reductase